MQELENYSGSLRQEPRGILRPRTSQELKQLVQAHDVARAGPITLRASGHSFHHQALGEGTVLFLGDLPHCITITPADRITPNGHGGAGMSWATVEVTGWTPWDAVLRACLRLPQPARWSAADRASTWSVDHGLADRPGTEGNVCWWRASPEHALPRLVPYCVTSSGWITVGGSLSADGVWRFSGVLGREGDSVVWLDLLTSSGQTLRLFNSRWGFWESRASHGPVSTASTRVENDAWFDSAVGGFGLVGVIVRVKYLLLELDPDITWSNFARESAIVPTQQRARSSSVFNQVVAKIGSTLQAYALRLLPVRWPTHPHSPRDDLGSLGGALESKALTWLRPAADAQDLWQALIDGASFLGLASDESATPQLPRRVDGSTLACFGLIFPNYTRGLRAVIGNLGFGQPPLDAQQFRLWNRANSWLMSSLLQALHLVPALARTAEAVLFGTSFKPLFGRGPAADPIPECCLFTEGNAIAQSARKRKSESMQQSWVIPLEVSGGRVVGGQALLAEFLDSVLLLAQRPWWSGRAVRPQLCDIKLVPTGRAWLCSSRSGPGIMVTLSIENGRDYRCPLLGWGTPADEFARLSQAYADRGVRVHLTKNLFVDPLVLRGMYAEPLVEFAGHKQALDPRGLWSSDFAAMLGL